MSLARLALRLAAVEALCPAALVASGPYPTLAGPRIYDSRIDPIAGDDDLAAIEGKPLVILYTEKDDKRPYNPQEHRFPAREQTVDLVAELMIAARGEVVVENPDGTQTTVGTIEAPVSDRQHEALLDILEAQIGYRLEKNRGIAATAPFHRIAMELRAVDSVPQRADDRITRLAARTVRYHVKIKTEDWDGRVAGALPSPLSLVAAALLPGSSGAAVCALALAAMPDAPPLPTQPAGTEIAIYAGLGRVPGETDADLVGSVNHQA